MPVRFDRRNLMRLAGAAAMLPAVSTTRDAVVSLRPEGLNARDFGARFDGRTDDTAALQRSIDEAARRECILVLPSGIAQISHPLNLKRRYIAIIGDPAGRTILRAARSLPCLFDAADEEEVIDCPLYLYGITIDGQHLSGAGVILRYRHRTVFENVSVTRCETGIDELDTWLSRRINCLVRSNNIGWRLRGSNHSSVWIGCTFTDASSIHLDIGNGGTAKDGNDALLFQGCDIEYGRGDGIRVSTEATATFDTCYLGENIDGAVLRNSGNVSIRGGALFVGHIADRQSIIALAGNIHVSETAIRGQEYGTLGNLIGAEANSASSGRAVFRDVNIQLKIGGDPIFPGNVLGTLPMRTFAPRLSQNWQATANNTDTSTSYLGEGHSVQCKKVTGPNPLIGFAAPLKNREEARHDGTAYFAIVYCASRPVELKATNGVMSHPPSRLVGTLPATNQVATYIKADVPVDFREFTTIELIMSAAEGDVLTLYSITVSDIGALKSVPLSNLARAQ